MPTGHDVYLYDDGTALYLRHETSNGDAMHQVPAEFLTRALPGVDSRFAHDARAWAMDGVRPWIGGPATAAVTGEALAAVWSAHFRKQDFRFRMVASWSLHGVNLGWYLGDDVRDVVRDYLGRYAPAPRPPAAQP